MMMGRTIILSKNSVFNIYKVYRLYYVMTDTYIFSGPNFINFVDCFLAHSNIVFVFVC